MYQQDFSAVPEPITGGRNYPYNVPDYRQQAGKGTVAIDTGRGWWYPCEPAKAHIGVDMRSR